MPDKRKPARPAGVMIQRYALAARRELTRVTILIRITGRTLRHCPDPFHKPTERQDDVVKVADNPEIFERKATMLRVLLETAPEPPSNTTTGGES